MFIFNLKRTRLGWDQGSAHKGSLTMRPVRHIDDPKARSNLFMTPFHYKHFGALWTHFIFQKEKGETIYGGEQPNLPGLSFQVDISLSEERTRKKVKVKERGGAAAHVRVVSCRCPQLPTIANVPSVIVTRTTNKRLGTRQQTADSTAQHPIYRDENFRKLPPGVRTGFCIG